MSTLFYKALQSAQRDAPRLVTNYYLLVTSAGGASRKLKVGKGSLFFALKVQYNLAQGNALGYDTARAMRPERGNKLKF